MNVRTAGAILLALAAASTAQRGGDGDWPWTGRDAGARRYSPLMRFITLEDYTHEREVRALLSILNSGDGVNRHFDLENRAHPRPIYDPTATLPEA